MWMCIHAQERTPWNDDDPPYYGGLQMGAWFIRTYAKRELARYGTPDRWSATLQIAVAERAYRREGYSRSWLQGQWPPSRGICF